MGDTHPSRHDALLRLTLQHQAALKAYAYGLLRDWHLAEDAVQEAAVAVIARADEYDPAKGGYEWVRRFVYYKVRELQAGRRRTLYVEDEELAALVHQSLDEQIDSASSERMRRREAILHECVSRLRSAHRRLLEDFYLRRESCEAMAPRVGVRADSLRMRLSRLRQLLRDCVERGLAIEGGPQ